MSAMGHWLPYSVYYGMTAYDLGAEFRQLI